MNKVDNYINTSSSTFINILDPINVTETKIVSSQLDGTPCAVKVACTVWSGGKCRDNIKVLPITISGRKGNSGSSE